MTLFQSIIDAHRSQLLVVLHIDCSLIIYCEFGCLFDNRKATESD